MPYVYMYTHRHTHADICIFKNGEHRQWLPMAEKEEESEADFSQYTSVYRFDFKDDVCHIYIYKVKFLRSNL